jgi:hypothetical protein
MTVPDKLPKVFAQNFDAIFAALKEAGLLLQTGRMYGLCIGLSPALAAQFEMRFGEDATVVLANTWRVDPAKSPRA